MQQNEMLKAMTDVERKSKGSKTNSDIKNKKKPSSYSFECGKRKTFNAGAVASYRRGPHTPWTKVTLKSNG